MSSWSALRLVASREIKQVLRGKVFWIVAAVLLVGSTAGLVLPEILGDDGPKTYDVALVDTSGSLPSSLDQTAAAVEVDLDLGQVADDAEARRLVEDGDVDIAVVGAAEPVVYVKAGQHDQLLGVVRQALSSDSLLRGLTDAGVGADEAQALLAGPQARVHELDTEGASRRGAAFLLSLAMYLLLLMLMMSVANGVAVEKANRVSEVLLAIVRPGALLFGKVLGVGVTGILTLLCGIGPVLVKMALGGDLPAGLGGAVAGGGAWFVLGTALYLVLAGSLASLADRQEEAGTVIAPLSVILVAAYLVGGSAPDSTLATVLSYIPLTSPMAMPPRIAVGAASGAEMALSLALSVLAVVAVARVGAVVYQRAIVRTGRRLKLGEVLRGA